MRRLVVSCAVILLCGATAPVRSQGSPDLPALSAEAMWQLKRLGDPAISPDGKLAVVPVTAYDVEKNEG